ncbi:MAG: Uma2 family endonuclease [Cyanobacteria bacterium J06635_1]
MDKRNQYEWRGIPEYWILDPVKGQVTVLFLTEAGYEETVFVGDEVVRSQGIVLLRNYVKLRSFASSDS